jgi:Divergent InlB B-repeat domain
VRRLLSIALWLALTVPAWAAGTHYYIAASGGDSNNGTSESTPWAHLPEMATFTGTYTHASGDEFTMRGCDVWTNANFPILWTYSNTSLVRDVTWYNTANCPTGWNRPVWNAGGTVMGGTECPSSSNNYHNFFLNIAASNTYWEWIETKGLFWAGICSDGGLITIQSGQNHTFDHFYMHDWSANHSTAADIQGFVSYLGGSGACGSTSTTNCTWQYGVIDNSDGDQVSGGGVQSFNVMYSVCNYLVNCIKPYSNGEIGGNGIFNGVDSAFDGDHGNNIETIQAQGTGIYYIHDNLISDSGGEGLQVGNPGEIDYVWNNVWNQPGSGQNGPQVPQSSPSTAMYFFNNTVGGGWPDCIKNAGHGSAFSTIFVAQGNHCVNSTSSITDGTFTAPTLTINSNVGMTQATATTQLYGPLWAPSFTCTPATCATLQAGTTKPSYFPSSGPVTTSFPYSDTLLGSIEVTINGVVQPQIARTPVAIPSSVNRDAGAYEFVNPGCGPPTYNCFHTGTNNPGTIAPIFISTAPTATTCSGACQNSTAYDLTINPIGIGGITRITDGASVPSGLSIGNLTCSGGDNDLMWSRDEKYLALANTGLGVQIEQISLVNGFAQVVNTGVPIIHGINCPFAWDYTLAGQPNVYFSMVQNHLLQSSTLTSISTLPTPVNVVDYTASGVCPGLPNPFGTVDWASILIPANGPNGSQRFTLAISTGVQGTGRWVVSYDTLLGCSTINFADPSVDPVAGGKWWTWCTGGSCGPSTPASGTISTASPNCWGFNSIHDGQASRDGSTFRLSLTPGTSGTQGVCVSNTSTDQDVAWQVGTGNTYYTNEQPNGTAQCPAGINCQYDNHPSEGISHAVGSMYLGYNTRSLPNVSGAFTPVANVLGVQDSHATWIHPNNDDTFPVLLGATDSMLSGTGSVYSPPYLNLVNFGLPIDNSGRPPFIFSHTFSCGPSGSANCTGGPDAYFGPSVSVGSASPLGNYFAWVSTHLQSLGNDNAGHPRADTFIVHLGGTSPKAYVLSPPHTGGPALSAMYANSDGFAVIIPWTADSPANPVLGGWETSNAGCTGPATPTQYSWTNFDNVINAQLGFGATGIVIHLAPTSSGGHTAGKNTDTPCYVFSSTYAATLSAPQLYTCADTDYPGAGTITPGTCRQGVDNTAFPVAFQTPFMTAWANAVTAAINHIKGASYASKVAYISVGGGTNGEWLPYAETGLLTQVSPSTIAQLQNVWINTYMSAIESAMLTANAGTFNLNQTLNGGLLSIPYSFADAAATLAHGNGFGLADQGWQGGDITAFANFGTASGGSLTNNTYTTGDHAYNYNLYPNAPIHEFQEGTASEPTYVGIPPIGTEGSLQPLVPYGLARGGNRFELYYADWQVAYDSTIGSNYTNYHLAYQQLIQALRQGGQPLTITVVGGGSASTVTDNFQEINCPSIFCAGFYVTNNTVTVTATPGTGYSVSSITGGGCSGTAPCPVPMTGPQNLTVTFAAVAPSYTLTQTVVGGTSSVSSSPAGVNACTPSGGGCIASFPAATLVTLTGTPAPGYQPPIWTGGCMGSGLTATVNMNANESCTATFLPSITGGFTITIGVQVTPSIIFHP